MRTLAFDGRMGASGDMLLGALVAAGADPGVLAPVEAALPVEYAVGRTTKTGIRATAVDVLLTDATGDRTGSGDDSGDGEEVDQAHDQDDGYGHHHDHPQDRHDHSHAHDEDDGAHSRDGNGGHDHGDENGGHGHGHSHENGGHDHSHASDEPVRAEGHGPHRSYAEVVDIVEGMGLPPTVERDALAVFELLGQAEAAVHGTDVDAVHFHEVGADDAIADVVGVALLLDDLGVERILTTPLSAGEGTVEMSHGTYPVPAPAVVELAERADWSLRGGPVEAELLTPTAAAILAHYADGVDRLPTLSVASSGYGAGGYDFPDHPNVLRALVGETAGDLRRDSITVLETNLDDATPEELGALQTTLTEAGARDVTVLPATMKKARPGHLVKVVVKPEDAERVARRLAEETGTLGVREHGAGHRFVADRRFVTTTLLVDGKRHEVGVKIGSTADGDVFDVSAEHDDALGVAEATDLPVRAVTRRAETAAREGGALADVLVHVVEGDRWDEFADAESYTTPSLDDEGFVHLSTAESVLPVAQYHHADDEDPRLLVVDRAAVEADLRFEETPDGRAYPHCYGAIPTDAMRDVLPLERDDEGRFGLPEDLG